MGTCKKRPQRDRGPRRAQVRSPCRILFCRHTASAQTPCRRLRLLDECVLGGCRLLPERRRESATHSAICGGIGNEMARNDAFGMFRADVDRLTRLPTSFITPSRYLESSRVPKAKSECEP